ncbi:MAG: hypothetical protein A2066_10385 [Bacteroidetes bacterium GWB2_41_8]|nr:MAG: hypothetical protein A2066_10385 [Bacteroidetes bacterium GWB2_41_8]
MLPEFPDLVECKKCRNIFWLSKTKEKGEYSWGDESNPHWENADVAEFLNIHNYFRALQLNVAESKNEELFIRKRIWWSFNDRGRNGGKLFKFVNDGIRWKENIDRLLQIFDIGDITQKVMIAELNRNLGDFDKCMELINSIEDPELEWLTEAFKRECESQNKNAFLLICNE